MSAFQSPLDLATLTAAKGIRLAGAAANEWTGWSLAGAGDVNGDGYEDIIVGAFLQGALGRTGPGSAYVVFGRDGDWGNIDLSNLAGLGFRIDGIAAASSYDQKAVPVSPAGDVNGDGYADLIIGAQLADNNGRSDSGSSFILYGHAGAFSTVDVSQPLGALGARIDGVAGGDYTGRTVANLGDFNGDGFDDVVVGGTNYASYGPGGFAGSAFVVLGSAAGIPNTDLASPGSAVFRIDGAPGGNIGRSVAAAGDLNGDGLADLVTTGLVLPGAQTATVTVVFGSIAPPATLNLTDLNQGGFVLFNIPAGGANDISVASAGDFNGDGYDDLIIGVPAASSNCRTESGSALVLFGRADWFSGLNNAGSNGFRIDGAAQYDSTGVQVGSAGDVNGDGYADILIGASGAGNNNRSASGSSTIILGRPGGSSNIDLANLGSAGFRIDGAAAFDGSGQVAGARDVDGDGFADILIGAYTADPLGRTNAGAAYLLFSQFQGGATYRGTTLADNLRGTPDSDNMNGHGRSDHLSGMAGNDTLIGGEGNDTLDGGPGSDNMAGGSGNDTYVMHDQTDAITEQQDEGNDFAFVFASGAITIGPHIETIRLGGAATSVAGSFTAEQIIAHPTASSTISGGAGDDTLWGSLIPSSVMLGGDGDDIIRGQRGSNTSIGGPGNDQYVVSNPLARVIENPGEGIDTIWVATDDFDLPANIEIARLTSTATRLTGSNGDEQIVANPIYASVINARGGNDVIWGNNFSNILNGDNGDDILRPQFGASTMYGGHGDDQFVIQNNNQVISEAQSEGDDTAWVAVNGYAVGAHVERINLSGAANTAIGNAGDNIIAGNPTMGNVYLVGGGGSDIIFGSTFADLFRGDAGNDTMYSLGGADRFVYQGPGWGYDAINGFAQGQARIDFTGTGISFAALTIVSANGNSQVEYGGSAILVFNVAPLTAGDFLF